MTFKDECGLCGRVFPYSRLRRCYRCRRLFCIDCMVPEVSTGDFTRMLCLRCARRVVSPRSVGKYDRLKSYLKFRASFTSVVKLSFAQVDGIIRDNLPMSAYRNTRWWSNSSSNVHSKAWLNAGWRTQDVNLEEGYVVFQKTRSEQTRTRSYRKRKDKVKKPFQPAPHRFPRTRKTSKTKAAKLYARLKNLERRRTSMTKYRGSFKPKPAQEKRLYKPDEKPK